MNTHHEYLLVNYSFKQKLIQCCGISIGYREMKYLYISVYQYFLKPLKSSPYSIV